MLDLHHASVKNRGHLPKQTGFAVKNVGITGFNVIEECGIIRWGREFFPDICVNLLREDSVVPVLDGLVISERVFYSWRPGFKPDCPTLLLTHFQNKHKLRMGVVSIDIMGPRTVVEGGIAQWLSGLHGVGVRRSKVSAPQLGPREAEVIQLLQKGFANEAIARELGLQLTTVKTYLQRIYVKLGAVNRAHAVAIFLALADSQESSLVS